MILVLGGTVESGVLIRRLKEEGINLIATVVSEYGAKLAEGCGAEVKQGILDQWALEKLIDEQGVTAIVDMTHPYAEEISRLASRLAETKGVPYYRYVRPATNLDTPLVERVASYQEAAIKAVQKVQATGKNVFLTIGSKRIEPFLEEGRKRGVRVICRVLPDVAVLEHMLHLGVDAKDIVAILGPFSSQLNAAMYTEYNAGVVVTKDAGREGGTDTKVSAAVQAGIPVVVIQRPQQQRGNTYTNLDDIIRRVT